MSTGTRVPFRQAADAAHFLVVLLRDYCERIEVAGSIRRLRNDVGDIELVAIPKIETEPDGMFAERTVNRLSEKIDALLGDQTWIKPHPTDPKRGERYSKLIDAETGMQLDLFSASPSTFGLIFLIRTGPASFSQRFVTELHGAGFHSAGGVLHRGGGWSDRTGWHPPFGCPSRCEAVPTPDEADVFAVAGWPFVAPELRA